MAYAVVRSSLVALGLAGALFAPAIHAGDGATYVIEGSRAAGLESCVEPTDFMRRNHMEVIKHQRDETVYNGIRSTKHSLAGCIECHVSSSADNKPVPVNAEGQFCMRCHEFAAVDVNCFGCHSSIPSHRDAQAAAWGDLDWHAPIAMSALHTKGSGAEGSGEGD
jgi:predicted CXXCH cytochrome family protein